MSAKYDELLKLIQGSNEKVVTLTSDVKNLKRDFSGTQKRALELKTWKKQRCRLWQLTIGKNYHMTLKNSILSFSREKLNSIY